MAIREPNDPLAGASRDGDIEGGSLGHRHIISVVDRPLSGPALVPNTDVLFVGSSPEGRVFCSFGSTGLSGARRYPPGLPADNDRSRRAYADRHNKHHEHQRRISSTLMGAKAPSAARSSHLHSPIRCLHPSSARSESTSST